MRPCFQTSSHLACIAILFTIVPVTYESLVDFLEDKLIRSIILADTKWSATVETGRCFMTEMQSSNGPPMSPLPKLIAHLAATEMSLCVPTLLFDPSLPMAGARDDIFAILSVFPQPMLLGRLDEPTAPSWMPQPFLHQVSRKHPGRWEDLIGEHDRKCRGYFAVVDDVMGIANLIGNMTKQRIIIVTRSPLWRIRDFLSGPQARRILNLVVVQDRNWKRNDPSLGFVDINLMTHRVFGDSLGGSFPQILTAWRCNRFTRPWVRLFPEKMLDGFAGHQFKVSTVDSPPFVYKTTTNDMSSSWDGYEVRILRLLARMLNFTLDFREPVLESQDRTGVAASTRVIREILTGAAEIGAGGVYITEERLKLLDLPVQHTYDCAAFMTLASVALPKYRAIFGPFQWTVWLAISLAYILAIIPLVFSHSLSLGILIRHPSQIENMFWYVFGTFTNLFTFRGRDTWVGSTRDSTRMIIGWYWAFSIIITACYTGCVISFIAFPAFPAVIDTIMELLDEGYRIGTLNSGGWHTWFVNSSDPNIDKLLKKVDLVPSVWEGIQNMTHASFFHPYAFLGSRLYLEYVVRTNYSAENKRSMVHITKECLAPFSVSLVFPREAVYSERFSHMLLRAVQSGLIQRAKRDVLWDTQRSSTGALLQASGGSSLRAPPPEERMLALDDTQGMFLLLGSGIAIGLLALFVENIIGRIKALRDQCPPGPRRRSSAGINHLWQYSGQPSARSSGKGSRLSRPTHGRYRRSVNSLPGDMLAPDRIVAAGCGRSPSIVTAPAIVLVTPNNFERNVTENALDEAPNLQTQNENEEYEEVGIHRAFSIFSWLSALAAKLTTTSVKEGSLPDQNSDNDESDGHKTHPVYPCEESSSTDDSSTDYTEHLPQHTFSHSTYVVEGPTRTSTEKHFNNVESVFGSRQEFEEDRRSRRLSLQLLKPLERMEAGEEFGYVEEAAQEQNNEDNGSPCVHLSDMETADNIDEICTFPSDDLDSQQLTTGPRATPSLHRRKPSDYTFFTTAGAK